MVVNRLVSGAFGVISGAVVEVLDSLAGEGVKSDARIVGCTMDATDIFVVMYRL